MLLEQHQYSDVNLLALRGCVYTQFDKFVFKHFKKAFEKLLERTLMVYIFIISILEYEVIHI